MRIVTIVAVICIFFAMGCEKSQPPESTGAQDAGTKSIDTTEPSEAVSDPNLVIIPGQGVGELKFGMSQSEMEKILGKPERTMAGTNEYLSKGMAVLPSKDSAVGAIMFGDSNSPDSPLVKACKYRTDKGIGMKSSFDDLIQAYGAPSSVKPMGQARVVLYQQLGATFTLQNDKVIHMIFKQP